MSQLRHAGKRLIDHMCDMRAAPPVGKMLLGSLLLYACLCVYGFTRM